VARIREQVLEEGLNRTIRVVLVDSGRPTPSAVDRVLNAEKPRVQVVDRASDSSAALRAVEKYRPDVVVLDLDRFGAAGLRLADELNRRGDAAIVVLTAGDAKPQPTSAARPQRAPVLVHKTDSNEGLLNAIRHVHLDGRTGRRERPDGEKLRSADRAARLTSRERWIVASVVKHKGAPNKVIAAALDISANTLRNHLASIYAKLGIRRRLDLVLYAMENGMDRIADT
jgi:DNA-binding NarL/FixJ family response regulator